MLVVVSPAKDLDFSTLNKHITPSIPSLLDYSQQLIEICKKLTPADIASLMHISDKLAGLNAARFAQWQQPFNTDNAKPAVYAFNGDVYQGLDALSLSDDDIQFAQQHLRILSGLYGVLRPLDLMQPYRLEMGTRLNNPKGHDLYAFWQNIITEQLNKQLAEINSKVLINLASQEYFKAVKPKTLQAKIITPVFKDYKNGQFKIISFYAKRARGLMARFVISQRLQQVEQLHHFDLAGYRYCEEQSSADKPVFLRNSEV